MGTTFLPVNENWVKYMENSERVFRESEKEVKSVLIQKADDALEWLKDERSVIGRQLTGERLLCLNFEDVLAAS